MNEFESLLSSGRELWRGLGLGLFEKKLILAAVTGMMFYVLVLAAERLGGTRTGNYQSRSFMHDAVYWFYYRLGINYLLIAPLFQALDQRFAFLDRNLLVSLPILLRVLIYLMVAEFLFYWWHRALHRFKFLWAFHTTHHAPERLTFASSMRFHPVEVFLQYCWYYVLFRIIGANPESWLPLLILMEFSLNLQHTQITWRLGPLYRVLVTPTFHSYHHSTEPAHYNKNFSGGIFSFWDYLFGTAVQDTRAPPVRLGLDNVRMPSLMSSLTTPFLLLVEYYGWTKRTAPWNGKSRPAE